MENHLISIGLEKFERDHEFSQLDSFSNNLILLEHVLCDEKRPIVKRENIFKPIVNRIPDEIRRELANFFANAKLGDNLFIYISCHGVISYNAGDLIIPTRSARLSSIKENDFVDPSTCLSIKSDFTSRETNAATVNIILDCCHAGAANMENVPKAGAKAAVSENFKDTVGLFQNIDISKGRTKFTFLLASETSQSAFDIKLDIDDWQSGLYANRLKKAGIDTTKKVSNLILGLFQISESSKLYNMPGSMLDEQAPKSWREKLELLQKRAQKIDNLMMESDEGLVNLFEAGKGLENILSNTEPRQSCKIVDPGQIATDVPFFFKSTPSRMEMLNKIETFILNVGTIFMTEKFEKTIKSFLIDANKASKLERTESSLTLETALYKAAEKGDAAEFIEIFLLKDHESKLKSEVSAAIERKLEKSKVLGVFFTEKIDSLNEDLENIGNLLKNSEHKLEMAKNETRNYKYFLFSTIILCIVAIYLISKHYNKT